MKQGFKRIVSMALIASMIATMAPSTAWAASVDNTDAAQVEAQTAADEEAVPAAESAAETEAVEVQTETEPAATEETEAQTETEETEIQTETEETETPVYSIGDININFQGANAAVAEQMAKDVEIDESDPAIQSLRKALEEVEIVGGEAGSESNESNISTADLYEADEADEQETTQPLTEDQINAVIAMYQQYLNQWEANANVLGVQNPFFLDFNDDKDGLGILGEMLALDGKTVDDVRKGKYSYNDLTGMIFTFTYGDKLGIEYYGEDVTNARDKALAAVTASGAQTKAQKLLVLNDWLAHNNTFDMPYIMNSGKSDTEKPMVAEEDDQQKLKLKDDVYKAVYAAYKKQITANFHDQFFAGIENDLRTQFYENAIRNAVYQEALGKDEKDATAEEKQAAEKQADAYLEQNKDAIDQDPDGFVRTNYGDEKADQLKKQADAFIKGAEEKGVDVNGETKTVEQLTQEQMANAKVADLDQDGTNEATANEAIPAYAEQAATPITPAVMNYWEGTQFGVFGMGTSVCLGYSKAYTYLVQCLDKKIYLIDPDKSNPYDSKTEQTVTTADGETKVEVCDNWKKAKELYYGSDGKTLNIDAGYTVDLVRIHFKSDVTMYGELQKDFGSDHYWNAVKVDGTWYYIDPCYTDVYTEVMSRDRVETDGDMNHGFFLFSQTSTESLYKGNYETIRSLYTNVATDKSYESSWMSRAASNVYYADGYAYYLYDSTALFSRTMTSQSSTEYKLVRHKLTENDLAVKDKDGNPDGDNDYETLINFTDTKKSDDTTTADTSDSSSDETFVSVLNKDGKMEKNDLLTKLYAQFEDEQSIYPSIGLTAALYMDANEKYKLYFNVSNDVLSYDPADGSVAVVKEYNTVSAKRDKTKEFGGMAFTTTADESGVAFTITNHPIAGLTIKDGQLVVSIATNFAFISGKTGIVDQKHFGYAFEETDYNPTYTNYGQYQQFMGSQNNDNDEFMWSANFVDTVDMSKLTGTSHSYKTVSVPAFCGRNAFTEKRCEDADCGLIEDGTRVEAEKTAHEHHYITFHEQYYTKNDDDAWNQADNYVCPECGACITEPVETKYNKEVYQKRLAIWNEAQKNAAEGHAYDAVEPTWSDDHTSVTFQNLKCETCANQINKLDCLLESDENATNEANRESIKKSLNVAVTVKAEAVGHTGTCEQGVTMYYKAADKTAGGVKYVVTTTETKEAGQHAYTGTWTWNEVKDDNGNVTNCTASVTGVKCSVGDSEPTEDQIDVKVVKDTENSKAATCTEAGKDVYTATATVTDADGKEIGTLTADPKEVVLPALGHKYGEPKFEWAEDNKTAKATFTCENDSTHVETVDAEVTSVSDGATCTTAGKVTYTATATLKDGDKEWSGKDTNTVEVSALGHDYSDVKFNWSDDYKTATATFTCKNDSKHVETVDATVTPETTAATCEVDGKTVYTATATLKDGDKEWSGKDTKEVKIPAIGHAYGQPEWSEWTEDKEHNTWTTTATFTCANDKTHVETPTVKVTPTSTDATCTVAGTVTYTATVEFGGQTYTNPQTKEVKGQPLGHDYQTTTTKATLSKDGSIVTKCTRCGDVTENTTIAYPKTITLSEDHYVYDGQEKKPEVSVVGSDGKAISADNYDVKYPESAVAGGSYDVVITFKGNYEGTVTKTFTIGQMDSELKYAKSSVTVDYKGGAVVDNAYTSKASAKDIKFTTSNKNVAAVDSEGNVTIVGPGTATITAQISGSESYKDAKAAYTVKVNSLATPAVPKVTNGKDGAVVTWTAVKNAETYSVWRKTSSTGWKKLATVEGTTYTDKTAESNQTYYYTIRCMNAGKNICTSDYNRTGTKVYYLAPSNISSLTLTSNGIVVKWNKVAGAKSYRIYRKTTGGYTRIGTVNNGNTTSYTDTTAESGKTYTYAVKPYNGNDSADYTGKQVTYLAAPTLSTLANAANGVSLKWNSISGAQKYYIYRKEGNGGYKKIAEVKDAVSYTDKSVTSGKNYTYAVRALKGSSMSAYTGKSINYLAQANVSALNNKDNGIEVKWSKVSGAKGYYVYRKEGKNSYKKIATITNANTTSYTDTSVKNNNGKAYTYTVRAYANNALAAYTGKSVYRIATPTITSVSNSRKGEVDVDWNGVKGAKGYQIQLSSDKSFSKDTTDETWVDYADGNGITITNCEKGDSFYFRVRAYKQNGSGTKYYSAWSTKSVKVTK